MITLEGIVIVVSDAHSKEPCFIIVTLVGIVILVIGQSEYW